jgi:hypothetical protein
MFETEGLFVCEEREAALLGFAREPYEFDGKAGTYLWASVLPKGGAESVRLSCAKDLDESTFPDLGSTVMVQVEFQRFGTGPWKPKLIKCEPMKVPAKA